MNGPHCVFQVSYKTNSHVSPYSVSNSTDDSIESPDQTVNRTKIECHLPLLYTTHRPGLPLTMTNRLLGPEKNILVDFFWVGKQNDTLKKNGQDPGKHMEDINQCHVVDLWWHRSLHQWWWHIQETQVPYGDLLSVFTLTSLISTVSNRFVKEIIKWLDYQSNISKTWLSKSLMTQTQFSKRIW